MESVVVQKLEKLQAALEEREAKLNQKRQAQAKKQQELRQAKLRELAQQRRAEEDYELYLYYACKYGPLESMLYVCSNRPGQGTRSLLLHFAQ